MYKRPDEEDFLYFTLCAGAQYVSYFNAENRHYAKDETEDLFYPPDIVIQPQTAKQVSAIMEYCHKKRIPVTPRGAGTGLAGGCLPVFHGVLLSMEFMNRIIEIDEDNLQVTVEPGVITEHLQQQLEERGLFYPPDPASRGSCFIGGNVATNAGGPRAVKYGVVRDYVINLEVVLPDGRIIMTGANTLKNSTGYQLTHLFTGSEGTLGVITKIVLKLLPVPRLRYLMLAPFTSAEMACSAVSEIFKAGVVPSALEFMERDAIELSQKYTGSQSPGFYDDTMAQLLIEVDGFDHTAMEKDCEIIREVTERFGCNELLFADSSEQQRSLWHIRRNIGHAVRMTSVYKEEDTVVPRARLPELLKFVKNTGHKYGFRSVCYGHAGDGNLHVNILKDNMDEELWTQFIPSAISEIFKEVKRLHGALSGEHGIGWVQKPYMPIVVDSTNIELMKGIKGIFDPHYIMNPGKLF